MRKILLVSAVVLALGACTSSQVQTAQSDVNSAVAAVQAACVDALTAGNVAASLTKGGAANTVVSINQYVVAGCATAQAVTALAQNSSSLAWLGQQTGALKTLTPPSAETQSNPART
ncbi:MAG: hypothetical protein JWL84_323 [Rhodospirillales bacterium]|jgi:D-alanyl-D-alanine dipeptidase|nr:hypothetical protein [Rhodospirillales bacterium]